MKFQQLAASCAAAAAVLFGAADAHAGLAHRYSFNTNTNDSVGTAHGVIVGNTGSVSGGQLQLSNPQNIGGGQFNNGNIPATGAFLDLPNGLISSAAAAGQYGAVSIEMWVTMGTNRDWAAVFSAGISSAGEGNSGGGNDNFSHLQITPRTGDGGRGNDFRVTSNGPGGPEGFVDDFSDDSDLRPGVQEHFVAVFDQSAGLPGVITVFLNGALYGTAPMAANLDLAATTTTAPVVPLPDVNVWVGRSQWPDSMMDGSVNELRIYDNALTLSDAAANFAAGPDGAITPEPGTGAVAAMALGGLCVRRRRR